MIRATYGNSTANILLSGERMKDFALRSKTRRPTIATTIQYCTISSSQRNLARKWNKRYQNGKLRSKITTIHRFSSVQSLSPVWLLATLWTAAHQTFLSISISRSLLKIMSSRSVIPSNPLILCRCLLLPSFFASLRVLFQWVGSLHQVAEVLEL